MSRYEDKLYDFITDPDNFEFAHEIWDKYEEIEERLIKEFWNDVKKYCDVECPQSFILKTNEDFIEGDYPELYFKKINWKFFVVGFSSLMDNPFLGVYLYDENLKKRTVNTENFF